MTAFARHRTGTTRTQPRSANLNGSTFGHRARIHQGDLIKIINYLKYPGSSSSNKPSSAVQAQLDEEERIDCRRSLSFRDIDARLHTISPVQPGTCDWFFETSLFRDWYDRGHDNGLLWIKGNLGTGKSTLMKHILEYCQSGEYVIAAYFFNAQGAELEKTPLGMLRSLLFQLLEHEPFLYNQLLPIFRKKQQDYNPGDWEWREPELNNFLLSEIPKCRSRPLFLIIDALDECSDGDAHKVAEFLQQLSTNATNAGITLKICLSSRHFPLISLERCRELILEEEKQHDKDIITYISSNLNKRDEAIEEEIREKSSGIFLWVVLVITILNTAYNNGKPEAMKQKLIEMPDKLEKVFESLLNRDSPDKDETILILQLVLFAKRPLTPEEAYFALIAGTNRQALGIWDPLQITSDIIRRRIISSSRGLVEILKGEEETVQFIHGSVNEFLVRNSGLQILGPELKQDPIAKSHGRLKDCCMSYLRMESLELPKDEEIGSSSSSLEFAYPFPFFEYASSYVFDHAEEAASEGQTELLEILKDDSIFSRVERFHNHFVYKCQFGAPLKLLHILAARGLPELIVRLLEEGADINAQGMPHGTALEAAMYHEHEKAVKTLLKKGAKIDSRGSLIRRTTLKKAFLKSNREILAMLIDDGAKLNIWEKLYYGSVFYQAVQSGDKDVIAMVLGKGAKVDARGPMGTALCTAAFRGEIEIVEMLLEKGAKINARGLMGTALVAAALKGEVEIAEMLLEKGAKINARGMLGTALVAAASQGKKEIAEMLLNKGAKIDVWGGAFWSALHTAVVGGHKDIVEMLLEKGANINARALTGHLYLASKFINFETTGIPEMLLEKGVKLNTWGMFYGTALQTAVVIGERGVIQLLLDKGAKK